MSNPNEQRREEQALEAAQLYEKYENLFKDVFKHNPEGEEVLHALEQWFNVHVPSFEQTMQTTGGKMDPLLAAYSDGQKSVFYFIRKTMAGQHD
jgi:hypothetical protein